MRPSTKRLVPRMVAAGTLFLALLAVPLTAIASAGEVPAGSSDPALAWLLAALLVLGVILDDGAPF